MISEKLPEINSKILDKGIRDWVMELRNHNVETCQSCEGGEGHAYFEPTIEFFGGMYSGMKVIGLAIEYGWPIKDVSRVWSIEDHVPTGPIWQITFWRKAE